MTVDIIPDQIKETTVAKILIGIEQGTTGLLDPEQHGGLLGQVPILFGSDDVHKKQLVVVNESSGYMAENSGLSFTPIEEHPMYSTLTPEQQGRMAGLYFTDITGNVNPETATFQNAINGIMNNQAEAMDTGLKITHDLNQGDQPIAFTLNYNPSRGFLSDGLETMADKLVGGLSGGLYSTGMAQQAVQHIANAAEATGGNINHAAHSQGNQLTFAGLNHQGASLLLNENGEAKYEGISGMAYGSPVNNQVMNDSFSLYGINFSYSASNSGDYVSEVLGGNAPGNSLNNSYSFIDRVSMSPQIFSFLRDMSPHSDYGCSGATNLCGSVAGGEINAK